jgi:hypothetical protein
MLTPATQCTAAERWNRAQNKDWHPCQRIRNADSSATQCTCQRSAGIARTNTGICQRIRNADPPATQCTAKLERADNTGICVRGSGMLTSVTHCTAKKERRNERRTNMASVPRIRDADSSATQCTKKRALMSVNKHWHLCQRTGMKTPLQTQCTKERWNQRRTKTGIRVRGSGVLTSCKHNALQRSAESAQNKDWHPCQRIRNADSQNTMHYKALNQRAQNMTALCQRINADLCKTCTAKELLNAEQTLGICVRGSGC